MIVPLAYAVCALATLWLAMCGWLAWRDRLITDAVLVVAVLLELALLALAVLAVVRFRRIDPASEGATFLAYAVSLPAVPPFATLMAIREKTRWAMVVGAVGGFTVAVMSVRVAQIWSLHA